MTLAGRYYQVGDAVLNPPPDRPIPVLEAAKGRRMLRLTALRRRLEHRLVRAADDRRLAELNAALEAEAWTRPPLRRTVGREVWDPDATGLGVDPGGAFGGPVNEFARAIDAHERLGLDDLVVLLAPMTGGRWTASPRRSTCGPGHSSAVSDLAGDPARWRWPSRTPVGVTAA